MHVIEGEVTPSHAALIGKKEKEISIAHSLMECLAHAGQQLHASRIRQIGAVHDEGAVTIEEEGLGTHRLQDYAAATGTLVSLSTRMKQPVLRLRL